MSDFKIIEGNGVIFEVEFATKIAFNRYEYKPKDDLEMTHREIDHNQDDPPQICTFARIELHQYQSYRNKYWQYSIEVLGPERTFYSPYYEDYETAQHEALRDVQERATAEFTMECRDLIPEYKKAWRENKT